MEAVGGQVDSPAHPVPTGCLIGLKDKDGTGGSGVDTGDSGDSPCTGKGHLAFILVLAKLLGEHTRL